MNFFKKKQKFEIEFYPISNKYFPKYNDYYLKRYYITGIIIIEDDFLFAQSFQSEKNALDFINEFKEQQFKKNIKIIPVN